MNATCAAEPSAAGTRPAYTIAEHRTCLIPGAHLSPEDSAFCARLEEAGKLEVLELHDGVRVTTVEWVGVVQLSQLQLRVVPKLAGEHLGLLRMLEWASGLEALRPTGTERRIDASGAHLLDLISMLFTRQTEPIVRGGLRSAYVEREEALPALRGRLLVDRQLRRRAGRTDRLECRFDERTTDIFDNQLLLAAARRTARRVQDPEVRRRVGRVHSQLADACDHAAVGLPRRRLHYDRLNRHYEPAHELAWLILEAMGLEDLFRSSAVSAHAFLIDMNLLFERFVEKLLSVALVEHAIDIRFQTTSHHVLRRVDTGKAYSAQRPDVLAQLGMPAVDVPLDAKYKRYSDKKVSTGDIAQSFMYAQGFGPTGADRLPQAVIVFPSETGRMTRERLAIRGAAGEDRAGLTAVGVPVVRILDELEQAAKAPECLTKLADWIAEVAAAA